MSSEFRKEGERVPRNNDWKLPKFGKGHGFGKSSDLRSWKNTKLDKLKESTYTKFRVKLVRTKDKEKSLESSKREKRPYLIEKQLKWQISPQKPWKPEGGGTTFSRAERKLSTQNPISSKNILQEWRGYQDIPRWRETKRTISSRPILKERLKGFLPRERRNLGTSGRRKDTVSKCMGKNSRRSLSFWIFSIIFHSCSKNYIIIILSVCRRNI